MQKNNTLEDLIRLVKNIGRIYGEENIRVNIDFDPNDDIILVKSQGGKPEKIHFIINSHHKTVSGIDTSKFWLPDYSKSQRINKRIMALLEKEGYTNINRLYKKKDYI
ncbi:MAG: hypothetical protein MRK02_09495 [Candidatus Scalindua sp.]|nr:hypothetical protein [Candidatus Scalindua sp.]